MKWIRKILQKVLSEKQYLLLLATGFQRLFKTGKLGSEYQDIYFLKKIIRPGDHCVDIGAHLGYYTLQFSRLAGEEGKVIAIEPVSKFNAVLRKLTSGNRFRNVRIHQVALGGKGEFVEIGIPRVNNQKKFGYARIRELSEWMEYDETEKVKNVSGDLLLSELPRIDFIKCDVEGAEVPVFASMPTVLQRHKPVLLCELADKNELIKMYGMLHPLSYETYILKNGRLHETEVQSDERAISHNYYFIPNSRLSHYKPVIAVSGKE
ncbi:MAG TPA: FkbM family methyltransferase [Chitinophagaceae bacterium]